MSSETTTMPTDTAALLVAGHINILWSQWANDKDTPGCCPTCCGPCSALKQLQDAGQLDALYGHYVNMAGGDWEGWDQQTQKTGDWINQAWSVDLGCQEMHDDGPDLDETTADLPS